MPVSEFLIRTQAAHDWPAVHRTRMPEVLVPPGRGCVVVQGPGDLRLQCGPAEVSFSGDDPGWHVVVDGPLAGVPAFLDAVTGQVAAEVGEPCEWVPLG